ncbi:MAG: hypothetical protein AAB019_09200, partial [Planctomycetota bacterium]
MKKKYLLLIILSVLLFSGGTINLLQAWCPDAKMWDRWEGMGGDKRETYSMYQDYLKAKPTVTPGTPIPTSTGRPPNVATGLAPLILNIEP